VPAIEAEKIVDTSSAGDAFVGGFLAQYVKNESIEKAIKCGIWASGLIIQRFGKLQSRSFVHFFFFVYTFCSLRL
jgi:adenosine kinase